MARDDDDGEYEVPRWMIRAGRLLGWSEVQARWKVMRLMKRLRDTKRDLAPPSSRVPKRLCVNCGAWQPTTAEVCASCGKRMSSPVSRVLRTLGISVPPMLSASILLGVAMIGVYAFMWARFPSEGLAGWSVGVLRQCGANYPAKTLHGEWWRLATCIFLHIGVLHIGFNTIALAQIGPAIEDVFGRGRMVFYFLLTGVIASFASAALQDVTSAGASGALMGLIGMACGWGQRIGTIQGRSVRDQMLKWAAYTMLFGFMVHADNYAHGAGFVSGAIAGYAHNPYALEKNKKGWLNETLGAIGGLGCLATVVLVCVLAARAKPPVRGVDGEEHDMGGVDMDELDDDDNVKLTPGQQEEMRAMWKQRIDLCERVEKKDVAAEKELLSGGKYETSEERAKAASSYCAQLRNIQATCREIDAKERSGKAREVRPSSLELCRTIPR